MNANAERCSRAGKSRGRICYDRNNLLLGNHKYMTVITYVTWQTIFVYNILVQKILSLLSKLHTFLAFLSSSSCRRICSSSISTFFFCSISSSCSFLATIVRIFSSSSFTATVEVVAGWGFYNNLVMEVANVIYM